MTRLTSSIYTQGPYDEPTGEVARGLNFAAHNRGWHAHGMVVIKVDDVTDDWFRQAVINYAEKRFGKRAG